MKVSVVVPAYNEEKTIGELIERIKKIQVDEIIVVDDKSEDDTAKIAEEKGAIVARNKNRVGPTASSSIGLKLASGSVRITIDADLEHLPEEIPKLLNVMNENTDVVIGEREYLPRISERVLAILTSKIMALKDPLSGLRAYRPNTISIQGFNKVETYGLTTLVELLMHGFKIVGVPVSFQVETRKSKIGNTFKANLKISLATVMFLFYFFSYFPFKSKLLLAGSKRQQYC
ncbi:MAG: glycosyltransferase family 2 protein [Promethearchaeota archaeon]